MKLVSVLSHTEHKSVCSCDLLLPALARGSFNWSHYAAWSLLVFPEDRRLREGPGATTCHSSFKELLVAGWCPTAAAVRTWT